jgi:hypothetical protein
MDRPSCPGFPVQKPAVSDHRRGGPDPGRRVRGGDEEDHQASSQVRIHAKKNFGKNMVFFYVSFLFIKVLLNVACVFFVLSGFLFIFSTF